MSRFRVVLFDLGGTLIHFTADWNTLAIETARYLRGYLETLGYRLDAATFPGFFRQAIADSYTRRDGELIEHPTAVILRESLAQFGYLQAPEEHIREGLRRMYSLTQANWRGEEDAIPMLEALHAQGYHIGLISNAGDDEDVQTLIDNARLRPHLEYIVTSAAAGIRKPHPRIFQSALDYFDAQPAEAVMVGDFLDADVLGANNLGMGSVWISRRAAAAHIEKYLPAITPQRTIQALSELPDVLGQWNGKV
jgi:HAD superfamily hydrolase (TIGR01662 family)